VILAQDEARHFNHNYVGTEHLLLGLLSEEEGVAAQALSSVGATLDKARQQVKTIVGYGEEGTSSQAPFTPRTKHILELALREALQLGHNYIGAEHMLLGLLREREGVAARVLSDLEVDPEEVRRKVVALLKGERARSRGGSGAAKDSPAKERSLKKHPPHPQIVIGRLRKYIEKHEEEAQRFRRKAIKAYQEAQRLRDALVLLEASQASEADEEEAG